LVRARLLLCGGLEAHSNLRQKCYSAKKSARDADFDAVCRGSRGGDNPVGGAGWTFYYVNNEACRLLEYSREELLSMTFHDIDPNFKKEKWVQYWDVVKKYGSFTIETSYLTKNKRRFPVEVTVSYLKLGDREFHCAFGRDITERKRAKRKS